MDLSTFECENLRERDLFGLTVFFDLIRKGYLRKTLHHKQDFCASQTHHEFFESLCIPLLHSASCFVAERHGHGTLLVIRGYGGIFSWRFESYPHHHCNPPFPLWEGDFFAFHHSCTTKRNTPCVGFFDAHAFLSPEFATNFTSHTKCFLAKLWQPNFFL